MATPTGCCGFECGITAAGSPHWGGPGSGTPSISTSTVRSGSRSLRCNPTAAASYLNSQPISTSSTRQIGRVYVYFATLPSADTGLIMYASGSSGGPAVRFKQSDSKIYAAVGTTFGASGVSVTTGQWYRVDFDFNVAAGNDLCDVQVDGSTCGQATAAGTSGSTSSFGVGVINTCTADVFFDDLLFSVTSADYPLGAGYINHFVPTSDGTHNIAGTGDFQRGNSGTDILNATTTAWQLADDVPMPTPGGAPDETDCIRAVAPPNATDYVECVFGPASGISTPTAGPQVADVFFAHHEISTTSGSYKVNLNDNGTTALVAEAVGAAGVTTITYRRNATVFATAPTGGAWTVSAGNGNFNNLRFRFYSADANPDQCLDAIMVEAAFSGAPASTFVRDMLGHGFIPFAR